MLFCVELITSSVLALISKQGRLNAAVRAFLLYKFLILRNIIACNLPKVPKKLSDSQQEKTVLLTVEIITYHLDLIIVTTQESKILIYIILLFLVDNRDENWFQKGGK